MKRFLVAVLLSVMLLAGCSSIIRPPWNPFRWQLDHQAGLGECKVTFGLPPMPYCPQYWERPGDERETAKAESESHRAIGGCEVASSYRKYRIEGGPGIKEYTVLVDSDRFHECMYRRGWVRAK